MPLLHILVLAVVQGITEFLPINSSGHLILVPGVTGWPDQGLAIDVAAHVGTLVAVLVYFWRDVLAMLAGLGRLLSGRMDDGARLALLIAVATLPALAIGFLVQHFLGDRLRSIHIVAWTMIIFGVVLYAADRIGLTVRRLEHMKWSQALVIGIAQTLAFVPGTSRSGITIVAARLFGFERVEAARFSFLLSTPLIAGAAAKELPKLLKAHQAGAMDIPMSTLGIGVAVSAIVGYLVIAFFLRYLQTRTLKIFIYYRILFGIVVLSLWFLKLGFAR